jgi:Ca2+-binding RTX toxin-like protein
MNGRKGSFVRRVSLATAVATSMLIALPSGVSAATQIGETFPPTTAQCGTDNTVLQTGSPNSQYAAPFAGVITSWSFRAGSEVPNNLKLKAARSAGGNLFMIVGESPPKNPTADMLNTFTDVRISVQAGDVIGYYSGTQVGFCGGGTSPDYLFRLRDGDQSPGTTEPYGAEDFFFQINFSALLEPDCDKDGLGDETQDKDIASCTATCRGQKATIAGTNGPDNIVGTSARDVIAALAGNDNASGLGGNDLICGGSGKDKLKGGAGRDKLLGQKGKDRLKGGGAKDICKGGKGNDSAAKCEVEKSI